MATTTEKKYLEVTMPVSGEVGLTGFSGGEAMSRLFSYQLELESRAAIEPNEIVGKNVTWKIEYTKGKPRLFNGFISRFAASSVDLRGFRVYRAEVVPWLWFLTRTSDCRIFQNKAAPDIIKQVFTDLGFKENTDFKLSLAGTYPKREYCVQYRETAFNFVSRLMEQEGIFYFFVHNDGSHMMVLGDRKTAYVKAVENQVAYSGVRRGPGQISTLEHQFAFRSGVWTQTDYNFETPRTNLLTTSKTVVKLDGEDKFELFDYPGEYTVKADGTTATKTRMDEEELTFEVVSGTGGCTTFGPGAKFTVETKDVPAEQGKSYVLTAVQHVATDLSSSNTARRPSYSNSFTAIPDSVVFRPARLTIKPTVQGPQPAVIVGPKGQEIYTDKYGRVKVQFFWDRRGKLDENSSCWMRVTQIWAGKRWGASFWPRIGQEVIVDFLEGDPDRPLIVGSVYNADQMPPYLSDDKNPGPDDKHKNDNKVSGIKTNSTPGGVGFNELRFDDTKGKEQVFIHGERNMDVRVKNESMERVISNRHLIVGWKSADEEGDYQQGGDQRELVYQDKHLNVKRNQVEKVEGNMQLTVGKGEADDGGKVDIVIEKDKKELIEQNSHLHVKYCRKEQVDQDQALTVGGNLAESVGGKYHLHVKTDRNEKVDGTQSLDVGCNQYEKVGQNHALDAGMAVHIKGGMTVVIEAGMQLTLKVGGNFVDISPAGVAIQGTMVLINSGGAPGSGSGSSPTSPEEPAAPDDAQEAKPTKPALADNAKTGQKSAPG
jgi:type VI secretion system secreted protein VgrG